MSEDVQGAATVTPRAIWASIGLLTLAVAVVIALMAISGVTWHQITGRLLGAPIWLVLILTGLTMLQIALSALKWRLVLQDMAPGIATEQSFGFFLRVSALSALLSQVLTVYLSSILLRSWALRRLGVPLTRGAASSLCEQIFDAIVLAVMVVPTLIAWASGTGFPLWLALVAGALVAGTLCVPVLRAILAAAPTLASAHPRLTALNQVVSDPVEDTARRGRLMRRLYLLSILRYGAILARVPLLVLGLAFAVTVADGLQAATLVQATQFASVTPGNIGISEWTWSGLLVFRGYDLKLAAELAIAFRILSVFAMTLAVALLMLLTQFGKGRR